MKKSPVVTGRHPLQIVLDDEKQGVVIWMPVEFPLPRYPIHREPPTIIPQIARDLVTDIFEAFHRALIRYTIEKMCAKA
jgi:hypothetical protein